jgi:hypothetical protein
MFIFTSESYSWNVTHFSITLTSERNLLLGPSLPVIKEKATYFSDYVNPDNHYR